MSHAPAEIVREDVPFWIIVAGGKLDFTAKWWIADRWQQVVDRHGVTAGKYLLYVGDVDWRKNADGMIEGLAWARARGADVKLAFAGVLSEERASQVRALASART